MKLRIKANTNHQDPEDWYMAYGAHVSTEAAGDVCIQEIDPEWMDAFLDDQDLICAYPWRGLDMTEDERLDLVARAREAWDAANHLSYLRDMAVDAYRIGDLLGLEDRLEEASREERLYGDDPAARELAEHLLEGDS